MFPPAAAHPSPEQLAAFSLGRVSDAELTRIAAHLADCPECCAGLDHIGEPDPLLSGLRGAAAAGEPAEDRSEAIRALRGGLFRSNPSTMVGPDGPAGRRAGSAPRQIGEYDVLAEVGRGGMGVVYHARHRALNRPAAVKMILAGRFASESDLLRFRLEAELAARVRHPNVVQVYEVGEHDGCPFLAMEWVEGGSLADRLADRPWPPTAAADLVKAIAAGVQAAHDEGVVHRDLKPANILLSGTGGLKGEDGHAGPGGTEPSSDHCPPVLKVTDFGLARPVAGGGLTRSGYVAGTPEYMAPEQLTAGGAAVGPAADVYALGVILFQLLTGRAPFRADGPLEVLAAAATWTPPRPRRLNRAVPPDLEAVCLKCLEKSPHRRYPSACELAIDLGRFLDRKPVTARRTGAATRLARWACRNPGTAGLLTALWAVFAVGFALVTWKWLEADRRRDESDGLRRAADASRREARRNLYVANVRLAHRSVEAGQLDRARQLLDVAAAGEPGDEDLRGFEWDYLRRLTRPPAAILSGHVGAVRGLAVSPDGRTLASAGDDRTVRFWNADTGEQVRELRCSPDGAVAFRPDGHQLAVAVGNGTVLLWATRDGSLTHTLRGHTRQVLGMAYSPDGTRLATASNDANVRVWATDTGECLLKFSHDLGPATAVTFSPDGTRLAVGWYNRGVRVCDTDGRVLRVLTGHTGPVASVAFAPDGRRFVSAGNDGTVRVWDVETGRESMTLPGHADWATGVAFGPGGKTLVTAGHDGAVRVWDATTGRKLVALHGHTGAVLGVAAFPDGRVASAGADGAIRVWEPAGAADAFSIAAGGSWSVAALPDGRMASGGRDGTVRVWDPSDGRLLRALTGHVGIVVGITSGPDGRLVTAGSDGGVRIWNGETGQLLNAFRSGAEHTTGLAVGRGGRLAIGGFDGLVGVWDSVTGRQVHALPTGTRGVLGVAFARDGQLVSAGADGVVRLWDADAASLNSTWTTQAGGVTDVACGPAGRLATVAHDGAIRLWAADGRHLQTFTGHVGGVTRVAFTPDGRRLISAGVDGTARLWDPASGKELLTLTGHTGRVSGLAVTPDGRRVMTSSWDGTVRVWEADAPPPDVLRRRRLNGSP